MAIFLANATPAVDFGNAFDGLNALTNDFATYGLEGSSGFTIYEANQAKLTVGGSGFTFASPGDGEPIDGTITSLTFKQGGQNIGTLSGLSLDYSDFRVSLFTDGVDAVIEQLLSDDDSIVGSSQNDVFFGKEGDDVISGLSGNDRLHGDAGEDILYGGDDDDQLIGGDGGDHLFGEFGNDKLSGGSGYNKYDGGSGVDELWLAGATAPVRLTLNGSAEVFIHSGNFLVGTVKNVENVVSGDGEDIVTGDNFVNYLNGSNGNDTLHGGGNDDNLLGGAGNDRLYGDNGNDELRGSSGDDTLDGGLGADIAEGGSGNDTYVVDYLGDTVSELAGKGTDTVLASDSFVLSADVENLTLTGAKTIDAIGNAKGNSLVGNAAANRLDGRADADEMKGGLGGDTYVVDNVGDTADEKGGGGHDTVEASVGFALGAGVEDLVLVGTADVAGTGNGLANAIAGNAGDNAISGGLGRDVLTGGDGRDSFVFDFKAGKKNADTVLDFEAGTDHVVLDGGVFRKLNDDGVLKAKFLAFGQADDGNDYVTYKEGSGKLLYDKDGDGGKHAKLIAKIEGAPDLDGGDILIV